MIVQPKGRWRLLPLLALICWCVGHAAYAGTGTLPHATAYETILYMYLPGAIAGILLGLIARTLGLPAIQNLLSSSQAVLFAILSTVLVAITLTGAGWADYNNDESGQILWTILSGAAVLTFVGIWSLLAMRAAAATRAIGVGATMILGAVAAFYVGFWGLVILNDWLERHQPELNVPIFFIAYLLVTIALLLPITLMACGTAGIVGALGRRPLASPAAPRPSEPIAPFVPPPAPVSSQPQPSDTYHGEEPSPLPAPAPSPPPSAPVPGSDAPASDAPQSSADDPGGEEVAPPSETDRG